MKLIIAEKPNVMRDIVNALDPGARLVKAEKKNGETIREFPVEVIKEQICSPKTLKDIQEILELVVSKGLGKKAGCRNFKVSGKTGTAQVAQGAKGYHGGRMKYLISFCGYYPSDHPKYSCIVAIQKSGLPASGGGHCGPWGVGGQLRLGGFPDPAGGRGPSPLP